MSTQLVNVHTALAKNQKRFLMREAKRNKTSQAELIRKAIDVAMVRAGATLKK